MVGRIVHLILSLSVLLVDHTALSTENTGWIVEYLMDARSILKDGYPGAGIPKVDPTSINTNFNVASEVFSGDVGIQGQLSGFSNYFVSKAVVDPNLFVELDVAFLSTTFEGSYSLNASAYKNVFPLSGSGPINIYFSYIEFSANGTLVGRNEMLQIKDFDFSIKQINAVQVTADGLLKDYGLDKVLAPALKGVLNTAIKMCKPKLESLMNTFVMDDGNLLLRQVTISKVLELMKQLIHTSSKGIITISSAGINNIRNDPSLRNMTSESMTKLQERYPQLWIKPTSMQ